MGVERYDTTTRWPAVMQTQLGQSYEVIEEALGARTTNLNEPRPELPLRNGLQTLPMALESHAPLDIVIFMLGTADCKPLFDVSPTSIADGMASLIQTTQDFKAVNGKKVSHIVVIAPPIIDDTTEFGRQVYTDARPKTVELVELYRQLSNRLGCHFIDSNQYVAVDPQEGIHITANSQRAFGAAMATVIANITTNTTA